MTDEIIAPLIYEEDNASKEKNDNEKEEKFRNYENDNEKERLLEYERALILDRDNRENLQNQEIRENRENILTKFTELFLKDYKVYDYQYEVFRSYYIYKLN